MKLKTILVGTLLFLLIFASAGCVESRSLNGPEHVSTKIDFNIEKLNNGDAKYFNDKIITSVDGRMSIYDKNGILLKNDYNINSNWIDVYETDNVVIYGNFNNEIGIAQFDNEYNLIKNNIVLKSDKLHIDPAIIKMDGEYYFTATQIEGKVNNDDENQENGKYTVKLFKTSNLMDIEYLTNILSEQYNIEDVDLLELNGRLGLLYEKERVDKGNSSIEIIRSDKNNYKIWDENVILEQPNSDHEPASLLKNDDNTYSLYYSCDKEDLGQSYMGSKTYESKFDKNLRKLSVKKIESETKTGILLYDVRRQGTKTKFLFAKDYLTDRGLVQETSKNN